MNATKIIPFPEQNCADDSRETARGPFVQEGQIRQNRQSAVIIDRSAFHYWAKRGMALSMPCPEISEKFTIMQERLGRIKIAYELHAASEVVTQSARIAVLAGQLGLPRTAKLAADIGEAVMTGQRSKAMRLIRKLEGIVVALGEDFQREVR